ERLGVARLPDPRLRGGDTGDPSGVRGGGRRRRRRRLAALQARHLPAAAAEPRDGHDPDVHLGLQRLRARLRHAGAIGRARLRHRPPGDVLLPHGLRRPDHRRGARPDRHRRGHRRADAADHRRGLRLRRALHDAQPDGVLMLGAGAGQSAWRRVVVYVVLGLLAVVFLFPIVLMVLTAFKTTPEIFRNPFGLPQEWTTQGFRTAWSRASFGLYLRNSLLITGSSAVLLLLTAAPAAYALARPPFRLRGVLFLFFLAGIMIPIRLGILPLYILMRDLGLIDTPFALILTYTASGMPMSVFLLSVFFRNLPRELEDAARIDGAGEQGIFWRIMLPLVRPGLATVVIVNVVPWWND